MLLRFSYDVIENNWAVQNDSNLNLVLTFYNGAVQVVRAGQDTPIPDSWVREQIRINHEMDLAASSALIHDSPHGRRSFNVDVSYLEYFINITNSFRPQLDMNVPSPIGVFRRTGSTIPTGFTQNLPRQVTEQELRQYQYYSNPSVPNVVSTTRDRQYRQWVESADQWNLGSVSLSPVVASSDPVNSVDPWYDMMTPNEESSDSGFGDWSKKVNKQA